MTSMMTYKTILNRMQTNDNQERISESGMVRIPNYEIREEFGKIVKTLSWGVVSN